MKYITLDYIKTHSRICSDCEDPELDLLGNAAEELVMSALNRTLDDLKEANGGEVPASVIQATLAIVENGYLHRGISTQAVQNAVLCGVDSLLKPWMVL